MDKPPIEQMSRWELVNELAFYAHPGWYQLALTWPTRQIAGIVAYYRYPGHA